MRLGSLALSLCFRFDRNGMDGMAAAVDWLLRHFSQIRKRNAELFLTV